MLAELAVVASAMAANAVGGAGMTRVEAMVPSVYLSQEPRYPQNRVIDYRQTNNGRYWVQAGEVGGAPLQLDFSRIDPGPSAYGAPADDDTVLIVRRDLGAGIGAGALVEISPWQRVISTRNAYNPRVQEVEDARNRWLRDHGFVGGVRTFVNESLQFEPPAEPRPQPVMSIERPTDIPKFRSKMQVKRGAMESFEASLVAASVLPGSVRVSLPDVARAIDARVAVR